VAGAHTEYLPPRIRLPLVAALLATVLAGCGVRDLSFVEDNRVDITAPDARDAVRLPLTVQWTFEKFDVGPGRGSFGVFLDRAPQPSGHTLSWPFHDRTTCKGKAGLQLCATKEYLANQRVFTTTEPQFTFNQVPRLTGSAKRRQFHEVTVVLLDRDGRRVGEGAWSVDFEVKGVR
jgi:hypothetical protein